VKKTLCGLVAMVFLGATFSAVAAEKPALPASPGAVKANILRATKMHVMGQVMEISEQSIKIERAVNGKVESMEFLLDEPLIGIAVNDLVKIDYAEKDNKFIVVKAAKVLTSKKKDVVPVQVKSLPDRKK
jgi:hypothetical protein